MNALPPSRYDGAAPGSSGSPSGREPHGDRASLVVRGRESRPHGEGRQVYPVTRTGKYARCETLKQSGASSMTGANAGCPWRAEKPAWVRLMATRRRKTLVVCHACHVTIHGGDYDGHRLGA